MIWLGIVCFLLLMLAIIACACFVAYKAVKQNMGLSDQRDQLVDTIEFALDELDECYQAIATKAEIDVLSDEPVIRDLINDIKRARNAMLLIASKVVVYGEEPDEKDDQ